MSLMLPQTRVHQGSESCSRQSSFSKEDKEDFSTQPDKHGLFYEALKQQQPWHKNAVWPAPCKI